MKRKPKLVKGYIFMYMAIAWLLLSSFITRLMIDFSWIFMVLFVMGIIELNSYRRVEKRKRPSKEEYKYVKWLVIEMVVVIMIIMVKCIFEIKM